MISGMMMGHYVGEYIGDDLIEKRVIMLMIMGWKFVDMITTERERDRSDMWKRVEKIAYLVMMITILLDVTGVLGLKISRVVECQGGEEETKEETKEKNKEENKEETKEKNKEENKEENEEEDKDIFRELGKKQNPDEVYALEKAIKDAIERTVRSEKFQERVDSWKLEGDLRETKDLSPDNSSGKGSENVMRQILEDKNKAEESKK